ncbi:MAG: exosortase-associated EpsI family protein [Kiritimatiellae bacterium]|nr:exosortase-associated EpsI family protein [Kiritimatiellia bacterium]MDD5523070.1 exosortase-associated EpsI family protein [Kiritimatiellia bacterium]
MPSDTIILKKTYRDGFTNHWIAVSVAITGSQRGSINQPELCLPGQGMRILKYHRAIFNCSNGVEVPVPIMDVDFLKAFNSKKAFFIYWFVSPDRLVSSQAKRLMYMAYDSIVNGVSRRWAYVSVLADRQSSDSKNDELKLTFVSDLYNMVQTP